MTIFNLEAVKGRKKGSTVIGVVQRGAISKRSNVQIVSLTNQQMITQVVDVKDAQSSNNQTQLSLRDSIDPDEFKYGWIISPPHAITCYSSFLGEVTLLTAEQGGRSSPIPFVIGGQPLGIPYEVILYIHSLTFLCMPQHPAPENIDYIELKPGETAGLLFSIGRLIPLEPGYTFRLQQGGWVVANGVVTEVY